MTTDPHRLGRHVDRDDDRSIDWQDHLSDGPSLIRSLATKPHPTPADLGLDLQPGDSIGFDDFLAAYSRWLDEQEGQI